MEVLKSALSLDAAAHLAVAGYMVNILIFISVLITVFSKAAPRQDMAAEYVSPEFGV